VVGKQGAKSLRGGTMEDVIFNGSNSRKPLGMAECVLTLRTDLSVAAPTILELPALVLGILLLRKSRACGEARPR
jgi:chromosome segregation protein